ncbi:MAG TPA: DNA repair exonuclease [Acetobacteraceae bacterium]|jgi:DNA repair exonuclease SbcCD nuclease subunit|nr:DNA repair exonuclease [Acetobacteraceae bacterium]
MATFRFLHCADLHLDSPLRGLEADPDAPVDKIRGATREALHNLVNFAIEQRVDFVVAAGDLYDGDLRDWHSGHFLTGEITRLTNAGIPFIAIRGNHDAESVITRYLRMPNDNARMLDHRRPETWRLSNLPVSIHGQSFATKAVTENLAAAYPAPDPDRFNIGLLHSSVGEREGHDTYASCSVEQLHNHGYDYWALGHVHKRDVLARDPWVVFPGNLQGRHIRETSAKGATLVTVTDGRIAHEPQHIAFDTVRWARVHVELTENADEDAALTQLRLALAEALEQAEGRLLAARIELSGACLAHDSFSKDLGAAREKIRDAAISVAGPGMIWTETINIATKPRKLPEQRDDATGQLIGTLQAATGAEVADDVRAYASVMLEKSNLLRQALGAEHAANAVATDTGLVDAVERARDMLLGLLDG